MQKSRQHEILTSEELSRKSFERKLKSTVTNLKAAENALPPSIVKDSNLIPNSVSTRTFEQGHTLHSLLCGAASPAKKTAAFGSIHEGRRMSTQQQENSGRSRIPVYRHLNNTSASASPVHRTPLMERNQLAGPSSGPKRKLSFSSDRKSIHRQNPFMDEDGYAIPGATSPNIMKTPINGGHTSPFFTPGSNPLEKRANKSGVSGHATDGDEQFESAIEESFDTEEREKREKSSSSRFKFSTSNLILNSTDISKMAGEISGKNEDHEADQSTLVQITSDDGGGTFIADLGKDVKDLKEGLAAMNENFNTVIDRFDRTLNESRVVDGGGETSFEHNFIGRKSFPPAEVKATQTPNSWLKKNEQTQGINSLPSKTPSFKLNQTSAKAGTTASADYKIILNKSEVGHQDKQNMDLHAERKFVLRQRIEALREYYRVRLYLLREEQRNVAKEEKAAYGWKFKQLMEQFDAEKQKIKSELRSKHVNKELLKKHCIQINKHQTETLRLNSRLNAIKQLLDKKGSSSSQNRIFSRFTSSSSVEGILPRSGRDKHEKNALTELISKYSVEGESTKERGSTETLDVFEAIQASIHEGPPEQMTTIDNEPIPSPPLHIPPLDFTQLSDGGNPPNQQTTTVILADQAPLNGSNNNLDEQRLSYATEMEEAAYNDDLMNSSPQRSPLEMLADLAIRGNDAEISNILSVESSSRDANHVPPFIDATKIPQNQKDKVSEASLSSKMIQQIDGAQAEVEATLSELEESGGNTSEDITSIPYPSEAEKNQQAPARKEEGKQNQQQEELELNQNVEEQEDEDNANGASSSARVSIHFEWKIHAQEQMTVGASGHSVITNMELRIHEEEALDQSDENKEDEDIGVEETREEHGNNELATNRSVETEEEVRMEEMIAEELLPSSANDHSSILEEIASSNEEELSSEKNPSNDGEEQANGVEIVSAGRSAETNSSRQRTSAEIESIPEELREVDSQSSLSSPKSPLGSLRESKQQDAGDSDQTDREEGTSAADKFHVQLREDFEDQNKVDNSHDSTMSEISEDLVSSFKPSDKSLRSILSSIQSNSASTGRESGSRRRSSASEALIKLRLMNSIPVITAMSPPESKSPPKTPCSPLGIDRFMAKFPHQSVSREGSFVEEADAMETSAEQHELLDELPSTSELKMILDLTQSPAVAERPKISTSGIQLTDGNVDKFAHQKILIDKYADALWKEYEEKGADYDGDYPGEDADETIDENDDSEDIMLRQLCCEYLLILIQTAGSNIASRHALSSKHELTIYLQEKVLAPWFDPQKFAVCSTGVRERAEKTSHFLLSTNRLLAIQHLYETMTVWPDENLQREIDLCIIDKLNTK